MVSHVLYRSNAFSPPLLVPSFVLSPSIHFLVESRYSARFDAMFSSVVSVRG